LTRGEDQGRRARPAAGRTAGRTKDLRLRVAALEWLLSDVDGVLTDGRLHYGPEGEAWKSFHVRDGLGLKLAQRAGLKVGLLSARGGPALEARAAELGLDAVICRREDKYQAFREFLDQHRLRARRVAYAGDDLVDLPILLACGLSFAPADAAPEVRDRVDHTLAAPGGHGAVREMVEWILRARGDWERVVHTYLA
jgi:3-deoxy-D-manno-octulosonate 8-phosphate phosphatase (KDO 8-P phosphatase)